MLSLHFHVQLMQAEHNAAQCRILERIQRRATHTVPGLGNLCYEERLEAMDLPSLTYRRLKRAAIEMYKYVKASTKLTRQACCH